MQIGRNNKDPAGHRQECLCYKKQNAAGDTGERRLMRCGGYLGDFAGEIRVMDLTAISCGGNGILARWQGGGTKCGEALGDPLGRVREILWQVYVDRKLAAVTGANFALVEGRAGTHTLIEVIGAACNVARLGMENVSATKPCGGDRVKLAWRHEGGGEPTEFRIWWDAGEGEALAELFARAAFEPGRAEYSHLSRSLPPGRYRFGLAAADASGNESALFEAEIEILGLPQPPANLAHDYDAEDRSVRLTWQ